MDFLLNPHLKASVKPQLTSDVHLFQQLVRHAPHYFPELQRQLQLKGSSSWAKARKAPRRYSMC
ncbi:hypothetical protein PF003_g10220 [Phytophthora fragariae]|nr:hypothetical protein PF003_g23355 [Phytophthora fragariae]KAE8894314.1 hypothetical protein PF003_g21863 [Phytophthora fragariae]KAE8897376.1 hypothetical protein PF003_g18476 [Phytophthora fragariae]KAE8899573.1 hypothetical protein PF003_g16471 [Phytophthora fragariae]KAE8905500.1 hypothetical protein PF003_g10462 [Phytophthora fragariae]